MKLRALSIERLAGLRHGLKLGPEHLAGRVRVLHGPNGIGKSSIVRALRALLWDADSPAAGYVDLEARFEIEGSEWTARRDGQRTIWFRDGSPATAPQLPTWSQSSQMLVDLDALALGEEEDIQEHLQRELRGGYDVLAVEAALRPGKQAGLAQSRDLQAAENARRSVRDAQGAVLREAEQLDDLRRKLHDARTAAKRVGVLEAALGRARVVRELAALQAELDAYPEKIELLQGKEKDELERIGARLTGARGRIADARRDEVRLAVEIAKLGLAAPIPDAQLDELDGRVEALGDAERPLRAAEAALTKAEVREARAAAGFWPGADLDRLAGFDEALDAELQAFARDASTLAEREFQIQAQLSVIGATAPAAPPEGRALAALEDWLGTPGEASGGGRSRTFLLVLAAILLVLAIALAFVHVAFAGLALLALVAFFGARSEPTARGPTRGDHEAAFTRTGEVLPEAWTAEAVRGRLDTLRTRAAEAAHAKPLAARRQDLASLLASAEEDARGLARRRENIAARLGVTAQSSDRLLTAVASARGELRQARGDRAEIGAECERLRTARTARLAELNDRLRSLDVTEVLDLVAAKTRVADQRTRSGKLVSLQKDREDQIGQAQRAQRDGEASASEVEAVYRRAGLEPDDENGLRTRLERLEDWKSARSRRDAAALHVKRLERDLGPDLAAMTEKDLERALEDARAGARPVDEFANAVTRIETQVQMTQEGRSLENALAERDACRTALETAFARARGGAFACALLADVRAAHEETSRPKVVEDAAALFSRFTRNRYSLRTDIVEGRLVIKALDAQDATALRTLDQLSDGTRAQLLLAVRLAYLREIEHGNPLPVVLDDALATTDPERMREIGAALLAVARDEDRQFLVLTKDSGDVDRLRPKDAAEGEVESTDLGALRGFQIPVATRASLRALDVPRAPEPAGRNAEGYAVALAEAGIPVRSIEPLRPIDELHLWWVLTHDLELLYRLLDHGIESVGVLRNVARSGAPVADGRVSASTAPWIELAEHVFEAWRIGRGRPIDREVLEHAGVSREFIDRMSELARDLGGDAKAWSKAVRDKTDARAKGYREKSWEANHRYLVDESYLDDRDVLDRGGAWEYVLPRLTPRAGVGPHELRERFELLWNACGS